MVWQGIAYLPVSQFVQAIEVKSLFSGASLYHAPGIMEPWNDKKMGKFADWEIFLPLMGKNSFFQ
jgi:hypothetical protein